MLMKSLSTKTFSGITILNNKQKLKEFISQINVNEQNSKASLFKNTIDSLTEVDQDGKAKDQGWGGNLFSKIDYNKRLKELKKYQNISILDENNNINIPDVVYQTFFDKGMLGNITNVNLDTDTENSSSISLISTLYNRVDTSNIYKSLDIIKPDIVFVQFRPDLLFNNYEKQVEYFLMNKITENHLFNSLVFDPSQVYPTYKSFKHCLSSLSKNGISLSLSNEKLNNTITNLKKIKEPELSDRVTFESLSMACLWAEENSKSIVLCDFPISFQIKNIINSFSLYEIKDMFKEIFFQYPQNPDLEPNTSLTTAQYFFPNAFVKDSDRYMAVLMSYLIKEKKLENAASILGYGQSISLPLYFTLKDYSAMNYKTELKSILYSERYKTLIYGEDSLEIITEKLSLLLLIFYGVNSTFTTQSKYLGILSYFSKEEIRKTGNGNMEVLIQRMEYLLKILLKEKTDEALELISKGVNHKKEMFMNELINKKLL